MRPCWARPSPGLPNPRVEPHIAHQLLWRSKTVDVADCRDQAGRDRDIDTGDGDQPRHPRIADDALRDLAVEQQEILCQAIELAHMPLNGRRLVFGKRLPGQPVPTTPVEQVGMRARRDQVRVEDGMHLVLDPRAMPDDLVAPRHPTPQPLGRRVGCPDLGQIAGCMQLRQNAGVDLVGLHLRKGDGLHLQRIGDDRPSHERRQDPHHRHRVAGRFDDDLVGRP